MGGVSMEWKLKDLTVDGKGSYGIGAPAVPYQEDKLTYLRITDINDDGSLNFSDLKSVDAEDAEKYILKENDIVFARTGNSTGRSYFYEKQHGTFVYAGFLIKFSLDPNKVNPRILKYYTHSKPYFDWVNSFDTGATRGNINAKTYGDMEIELPSRKVQDKIVSILSSLDRKIELNDKINADLEEMAQAIFKNWFVDFEPFKDGKFVDSELGMIPEGWKVGTLGDITKNKSAKVKERNDVKVLSPVTTGELVLSEEYFTKQVFSSSIAKYKIVNKGDFAYNPARVNIGSLGRNEFDFDGCVSPVYVVFSVLDGYENYFDLFRKTDFFKDSVASLAIGGVRQSLSYDDLSSIEVIIPSENAVEEFNNLYNQMKKTIKANKLESSRLSLLRDTLLPRLMSGELEVPE